MDFIGVSQYFIRIDCMPYNRSVEEIINHVKAKMSSGF
jgi:hypothetical protein